LIIQNDKIESSKSPHVKRQQLANGARARGSEKRGSGTAGTAGTTGPWNELTLAVILLKLRCSGGRIEPDRAGGEASPVGHFYLPSAFRLAQYRRMPAAIRRRAAADIFRRFLGPPIDADPSFADPRFSSGKLAKIALFSVSISSSRANAPLRAHSRCSTDVCGIHFTPANQ
jgi:hypothetical protein